MEPGASCNHHHRHTMTTDYRALCAELADDLLRLWHCSQPTVSRRLGRLHDAGLLNYRSGGGRYRIRRLGPSTTTT